MFNPVEGGSVIKIGFDDEFIECHLPPVGKTWDRIPDPETGKVSMKLVPSDILFEEKDIIDRKWERAELPPGWDEWRKEEIANRALESEYVHPKAEAYREQEWTRRLNGVWMSIGSRDGHAEYVYLTGLAYFYFQWWKNKFGYARFRFTYLKVFYPLQWSEDSPYMYGVALSTLRRYGKSAIAGCWAYEATSRTRSAWTGMQAQNEKKARQKFLENIVYSWRNLPDFFRPTHDTNSTQTSEIAFKEPTPKGKKNIEFFGEEAGGLHSKINYMPTDPTAYDGEKLLRYWIEEPGKWSPENVYDTLDIVLPAMKVPVGYGQAFLPTTIEEENEGGDNFIRLFEDSFSSLIAKNNKKYTNTMLIAIFIPAYEGYLFSEYGRSIIDDPAPDEEVYGEDGERIYEGAKTILLEERNIKKHDSHELAKITRKYPFTWTEAKLMGTDKCHFNAFLLTEQINKLNARVKPAYVMGNLEWVDEIDGDVEFVPDPHGGRFAFSYIPDVEGEIDETTTKVLNRVGKSIDWDDEGNSRTFYHPRNDRLFAIGTDPMKYQKTDDPRASKAAAYIFRKYDPAVDHGVPKEKWKSYNFIAQYLIRPDFEIYAEDMIKACRFMGCSILPEDNVKSLRQYFDTRGYGAFILYRKDFSDDVLALKKKDQYDTVDSNPEVIDTYMRKLNTFFNRHVKRIVFVDLLKQALKFDLAKPTFFDAVIAAGYTLVAAEADVKEEEEEEENYEEMFPMYSQDGTKSKKLKSYG